MEPAEGGDLLDTQFGTAGESAPPAQAAVAVAAAAASSAAPATASAPDNDFFGDDDWDGFQSALPSQAAPASAASVEQPSKADATAADSFDPIMAPPKEAVPVAASDPFGCLEELQPKGSAATENLISLVPNNEFDPVLQPAQAPAPPAPAEAPVSSDPMDASAMDAFAGEQLRDPEPPQSAGPEATASGEGAPGDLLGLGEGAVCTPVPAEDAAEAEVEDDKKVVYVYHKGEKNVVGWYTDLKSDDIKEAILCACDAIIDGGFVLREVVFSGDDETTAEPKEGGKIYEFEEFDQLDNGQTYIIEAAKEREDLKSLTGDRWRRLKVQVEPLLHVEANKAVDRMRRGSNLLKHTHYGFPHLRQFQLSDDRKRLIWYSGAKQKEDSVVQLEEVAEIRLGQTTPVFLHYRLPMLEHLSFSLVYGARGTKTLDLTCKDEFEFDHWVTGLKAILYHFKNRQISKEELLGHSKRFKKALEKSNCGIKLTKLPEVKEKGHVGLDDCIEIVTHTPQQLDSKMSKLRERLKTMSQQVARLDHHSAAEMEVDLSLLTGQGPAYASVFVQDEDAQDEEMEIRRMHELVEQTTQVLQQAQNELIALKDKPKENAGDNSAKVKKRENTACKHIDQLLWKAEVDLENVEDMYLRHVDNQRDTAHPISVSIAELNSQISQKLDEVRNWFG